MEKINRYSVNVLVFIVIIGWVIVGIKIAENLPQPTDMDEQIGQGIAGLMIIALGSFLTLAGLQIISNGVVCIVKKCSN